MATELEWSLRCIYLEKKLQEGIYNTRCYLFINQHTCINKCTYKNTLAHTLSVLLCIQRISGRAECNHGVRSGGEIYLLHE